MFLLLSCHGLCFLLIKGIVRSQFMHAFCTLLANVTLQLSFLYISTSLQSTRARGNNPTGSVPRLFVAYTNYCACYGIIAGGLGTRLMES